MLAPANDAFYRAAIVRSKDAQCKIGECARIHLVHCDVR